MPCNVSFLCIGSKGSCESFPKEVESCPHFKNGYCGSDAEKAKSIIAESNRIGGVIDTGKISDGRYTFDELYALRDALIGALANTFRYRSWKCNKVFPNYVGIELPTGPLVLPIPVDLYDSFPGEPVEVLPEYGVVCHKDNLSRLMNLWEDPDTKLYIDTIRFFGRDNQIQKSIEELAELIRALSRRDQDNIDEEMADVCIMLAQLNLIFGNKGKVSKIIQNKKKRLYNRINGKKEF